jgi:hypothetical protein
MPHQLRGERIFMSHSFEQGFPGTNIHAEAAQTAYELAAEALPGRSLHNVAAAKVGPEAASQLTPEQVYDVLVPLKEAAKGPARWEMLADAPAQAKAAAEENRNRIFNAAERAGLIRSGVTENYSGIDPNAAVFVIADGANKTSIVRSHVASQAISALGIERPVVYHLGSEDRIVKPERPDGSANPEHRTLRELAGEFLPQGPFTSFDANLATALASGYEIQAIDKPSSEDSEYRKAITLVHRNSSKFPDKQLVSPRNPSFEGGLDAVSELEANKGVDMASRQPVIGHNGQYRGLAEFQVGEWAESRQHELRYSPVVLGDEPGDHTPFRGTDIVTAERAPLLYVNELALLARRATAHVVAHGGEVFPQA